MITVADITVGAKFETPNGTMWIVDAIEKQDDFTVVRTSIEGGKKGNYRDEINECVASLNEEHAQLAQDWVLVDENSGKYLTLFGFHTGFTDNIELAQVFNSQRHAVQFIDENNNDFDELVIEKPLSNFK